MFCKKYTQIVVPTTTENGYGGKYEGVLLKQRKKAGHGQYYTAPKGADTAMTCFLYN